jgi:hypothetical protein
MLSIFVQFDVFHVERLELKAEQLSNMHSIFVQIDVFHVEFHVDKSLLKAEQP